MRFDRSEAQRLRSLARRVRRHELPDTVSGFEHAADAAETGEPLILECESPLEAEQFAVRFVVLGVKRPAVEELMEDRPSR